MNQQILEYDLYLDESGDFMEVSTVEAERRRSKTRKRGAQSQLAGLLVPRLNIDEPAKRIVDEAKARARLPSRDPIHATDILKKQSRYQYQETAEAIIRAVKRQTQWQPVRLVNLEEVSYYDRPATYANLVAELLLRVFETKSKAATNTKVCIRLIDPSLMIDEPGDPVKHKLAAHEYRRRIYEYLGFATVRYGLARQQRGWRFDDIIGKPYRETPAMQICDVLSNASYHHYENLQRQNLKLMLAKLFGEYDFTLTIRELFERVDELVKEHSFGMALMIVAEALIHTPHATKLDQDFTEKLQERLDHILKRLGRMDFRGRDPQLALLIGWLDQLVGQQRLLDKGYEITQWLFVHVEAPLRRLVAETDLVTLDWFAFSLRRWAMTACNHQGVLLKAQAEVEAMKALQPSVAKQWERIPLVMDGLIAQAVHYTDCFEFDEASRLMHFVSESLKTQSNRFHELMPNEFPEKLRFDLRARALGTYVQSEIFAGATDVNRLQNAREASDEAIAEFTSFSDRSRQYQYRCHLETVARDFSTARRYLVKSLEGTVVELTDYSHDRIVGLIRKQNDDPEWKAEFTLVHWLRIGAYASLKAHEGNGDRSDVQRAVIESERDQFLAALDGSDQLDSNACQGRLLDYPAHSILRFVAVINAAHGKWDDSLTALQRLHALDPIGKGQFVLGMIQLAAQSEVAALMWQHDEARALSLLDHNDSRLIGLRQLANEIEAKHDARLAAISAFNRLWLRIVESVGTDLPPNEIKQNLLQVSRMNAY